MKTNVTQTSIEAYHDISSSGVAGACHQKLLNAMQTGKTYTRRQLARLTGLETSCVAGRVNELIKAGLVGKQGKTTCPITKRNVEAVSLMEVEEVDAGTGTENYQHNAAGVEYSI